MSETVYISPFWNIAFSEEASFGSAVDFGTTGIPKFIGINYTNYDIILPDRKFEQRYGGSTAKPIFTIEKNREYRATYEWQVQNAQLFKQMMGRLVTTGAGPYTHTFTCGTPLDRPLPSIAMCFWMDLDGDDVYDAEDTMLQYGKVRLPKFDFTFAEGEDNPLKVSSDFWVCTPSQPAAFPFTGEPTKITTAPYIMKKNANLLNIWTANYAKIISGRVTVDHQPEFRWYEEGEDPTEIITGEILFELELVVHIFDRSVYEKALGTLTDLKTNVTLSFARGADFITFNITGAVLNTTSQKGDKATEATLSGTFEDLNIVFLDTQTGYPL